MTIELADDHRLESGTSRIPAAGSRGKRDGRHVKRGLPAGKVGCFEALSEGEGSVAAHKIPFVMKSYLIPFPALRGRIW